MILQRTALSVLLLVNFFIFEATAQNYPATQFSKLSQVSTENFSVYLNNQFETELINENFVKCDVDIEQLTKHESKVADQSVDSILQMIEQEKAKKEDMNLASDSILVMFATSNQNCELFTSDKQLPETFHIYYQQDTTNNIPQNDGSFAQQSTKMRLDVAKLNEIEYEITNMEMAMGGHKQSQILHKTIMSPNENEKYSVVKQSVNSNVAELHYYTVVLDDGRSKSYEYVNQNLTKITRYKNAVLHGAFEQYNQGELVQRFCFNEGQQTMEQNCEVF